MPSAAGQRGKEKLNLGKPTENLTGYHLMMIRVVALPWLLTLRGIPVIVPPTAAVFVGIPALMVGIWALARLTITRDLRSKIGVARIFVGVEIMAVAVIWLIWETFAKVMSLKFVVAFWAAAWVVAEIGGQLTCSAVGHLVPRLVSCLTS